MRRFVEGLDRGQSTLFPERVEDWIGEDSPVRVIDFFVDEDGNDASPAPVGSTRIVNNSIISVGLFEQAIEIDTREIFDGCFHIADNNNGSGGSLTAEIDLAQGGSSILEITQASTAALSTANNGSVVIAAGAITFNGSCTNPALPSL